MLKPTLIFALLSAFLGTKSFSAPIREYSLELKTGSFEQSFDLDTESSFEILNAQGSLEILGTDENKIRIEGSYKGQTNSQLRFVEEKLGQIKIEVLYPSTTVSTVEIGGMSLSGPAISIKGLSVSPGSSIIINGVEFGNTGGSMDINLEAPSARLQVFVPKLLMMNLKAVTYNDALSAKDFDHSPAIRHIDLETNDASVIVSNAFAPNGIKIKSREGIIDMTKIQGDLSLESRDTPIHVRTSKGALRAQSRNGEILVSSHKGDCTLTSNDGAIQAEASSEKMEIQTRDGRVSVTDHEGAVSVTTRDGGIHLNNPKSPRETTQTRRGQIRQLCEAKL